MSAAQHIGFQAKGFQLPIPGAEGLAQLLCLAVEAVQVVMGLLQHEGCGSMVLLRLLGGGGKLFQAVQPDGNLHAPKLVLQLQILFCLLRLDLQRLQLQFQFGNLVADAEQVILGMQQFPFGLFLAVTVLGDSGSFLKDLPAVGALQGKDLVDPALADIGIAFLAQTRIHEHLMDIPEPGGLLVDVIFAVAAAVKAAGDHHLVRVIGKGPVGIVQGQSSLRKAHGRPLLGAAEDNILHFGTPEGLGTLLAHDPEDGVGNVGFTGAIGANDGSDIIAKPDQRFIRKGLESLQFQ